MHTSPRIKLIACLATFFAALLLSACASTSPAAPISEHAASGLGVAKKDGGIFIGKHEAFLRRGREGPVGLLFLGDSITEGWAHRAPVLWQQTYGQYQPANFGIGGDRVEHVLWRIDNGELEYIKPRVIVLMIGTNNSASQNAQQIADSIRQILALIQHKLPETKVLLLGVLPRGPRPEANGKFDDGVARMQVIHTLNAELARLDDGKRIRYLDIGPQFLRDGKIPVSLMPDQLHPSLQGYEIWVRAMQPLLDEMLAQR